MKNSFIAKIIISALALAVLAGCGTPAQDNTSSSTADTSTTESAASTASVSDTSTDKNTDTSTAESQTESSEESEVQLINRGKCGIGLVFTLDSNGTMIIEKNGNGTGKMYDYGDDADEPHTSFVDEEIKKVIIKDGVTSIGSEAFAKCENLISVEIPDSVTSIGKLAFTDCKNLTDINIPNSITNIEDIGLSQCDNIKNISLDSDNKNYIVKDGNLFTNDMTTLLICTKDKAGNYTVPNTVKTIQDNAFYCCKNLTDIELPNSVTNIGENTFVECSGITNINIPNNLKNIESFYQLKNLKTITVDNQNSNYTVKDGVLFNKDMTELMFCTTDQSGEYIIPDTVNTIHRHAFQNCQKLTSVTISGSIKKIESYTLSDCDNLITIKILDGVTSIGDNAIYNCVGVQKIYIPSSVTDIGEFLTMGGLKGLPMDFNATIYGKSGSSAEAFVNEEFNRHFYTFVAE